MRTIDLFAGAGGWTEGASKAGMNVIFAANHNPKAVEAHKQNHPNVIHACQDLHQINWEAVPTHDLLLASPCCQGHSKARGKKEPSKQADKSRSTAWAVVSCLEVHRSEIAIIENVSDFQRWLLFPVWEQALKTLGYSLSYNILNAKNFGIPQSRERLFIVATRSQSPLVLTFDKQPLVGARSIIDFNTPDAQWSEVKDRVEATRRRVRNGQQELGNMFIDSAYGTGRSGHSLDKPIGTITCVNKHSLVVGDKLRPLTITELAAAQTFDKGYIFPSGSVEAKKAIGNAVPPLLGKQVIEAVMKAA